MKKKKIGYILYGLLSRIFGIIPVKKGKTVFFMVHKSNFQGNLKYVYKAMKEQYPKREYKIISKEELLSGGIGKKIKGMVYFYLGLNYHLATAEYIFLNDNFMPLSTMHISKKTKIIQLWHGVGAWKRFGLTTETDKVTREAVIKGNKKVSHLFVSGKRIVPFYEEALGIAKASIYPVGLPVLDFYFSKEKREKVRAQVYEEYPELKGKKVLLYTPTFRNTNEENRNILKKFSVKKIKEKLGDEWAILVRLHPIMKGEKTTLPKGCYEMSDYPNLMALYEVADVLVNDYSSTMVEYALLNKPIVLFAYDLEKYDRGFYFSYEEYKPGPIVKDIDSLVQVVKEGNVDLEQRKSFLALHYDYFDGNNTKRVMEILEATD